MLNSEQNAAVKYVSGPLLVLAGAGSGKTRVISYKIKHLIEHCGYLPQNVFAVTFTNKAASEMKERIAALLPTHARRGLIISTFHTLGLKILKHNPKLYQLQKNFSILDNEDCFHLIRDMLPDNRDKEHIQKIQQCLSRWKSDLLAPDMIVKDNLTDPVAIEALSLYPRYINQLITYNAVDFDDLLYLPVQRLEIDTDLRQYWQNKVRYLLVDEYQDSNMVQYRMVQLLTSAHSLFTVVGDDDQSIYAWRGAKPENLLKLQQDYPILNVIKLEQNYRSTNGILKIANLLIRNNPHWITKNLWSISGEGDAPRVIYCKDEQEEAEKIIYDLMNHKLKTNSALNDYAILYRSNHQSRPFEKILQQHGLSYQMSGGQSWFAKKEIKDMLAYLKMLTENPNDAAFLRIINTPKRGVGEATLATLSGYAREIDSSLFECCDYLALTTRIDEKPRAALSSFKHWINSFRLKKDTQPISTTLKTLFDESKYESYLYSILSTSQAEKSVENIFSLFEWIERLLQKEEKPSLTDVLNTFVLLDVLDKQNQNASEGIQLLTLHTAKGLEFPYVYLVGLEEGILPHQACVLDPQIEEERRLLYVGITRAERGLTLTLAKQRRKEGSLQLTTPSRFLDELPEADIQWIGKTAASPEQMKRTATQYLADIKKQLERPNT